MELENSRTQLESQGLGVAAISFDSVAVLHNFAQRKSIHIPLLSDAGSKIIRAYGILNETVGKDDEVYGIPHPGTFLLDASGKVVSKDFEEDFRDRVTAASILASRFGAAVDAAKSDVVGKQALLSLSASNATLHVGERITLVIDVTLKPGMHVYAPGVDGYIPVAWAMGPSPSWTAHDAVFPASEKLRLEAIQETVPVYQNHIRITRDVTVGQNVKPGPLTVEGTFRYQACDDRVCYIPQTLPLKWTFEVQPLDRARVPAAMRKN